MRFQRGFDDETRDRCAIFVKCLRISRVDESNKNRAGHESEIKLSVTDPVRRMRRPFGPKA